MISQWLLSIVSLSLLFAPFASAPQGKSYTAERFDVAIVAQPDGSLLVTETLVFRFTGGPFTYAFRHLPINQTDGVEIMSAAMDGVRLPRGAQAGQVEVEERNPIEITWHFAPTSDSAHTFELTYRVRGVIRQEPDADLLRWQALPEEHDYAIARSTVVVTYPQTAKLLGEPQLIYGAAQAVTEGNTVTFTAQNLGADDFFIFELRFGAGSLISAPPQWQAERIEAQVLRTDWGQWAVPSVLVTLVTFFMGLLGILNYQKRLQLPAAAAALTSHRPPADRSPALAGVLAQQGSMQYAWDYALGTFFALAQRGIVNIEESAESRWHRKHTFILRLLEIPDNLRPHERATLDVFFGTKKGLSYEVAAHTLQNTVGQRVKRFQEVLKSEVAGMGLFSVTRQRGRNALIGWGMGLLLLGSLIAVTGLIFLTQSTIGPWPMLVPGGLFLLGIVALIAAGSTLPLADQWADEVASWYAFKRYLKDVTRGRETLPYAAGFTEYLSYAAAFGLADSWANFLKHSEGVEAPIWFHGLTSARANSQAGFVPMIATVNASGASSGASAAGAAAGAAGGGASGAG